MLCNYSGYYMCGCDIRISELCNYSGYYMCGCDIRISDVIGISANQSQRTPNRTLQYLT